MTMSDPLLPARVWLNRLTKPPKHEWHTARRKRREKLAAEQRANPQCVCSRFVGLPERDDALTEQRRKERNKRKAATQRRRA